MFFKKGLPCCEEHGASDVQPDPFSVVSSSRIDSRAVSDALRFRTARFGCAGGDRGRVLTSIGIFIVVIIVVIIIIVVTTKSR